MKVIKRLLKGLLVAAQVALVVLVLGVLGMWALYSTNGCTVSGGLVIKTPSPLPFTCSGGTK